MELRSEFERFSGKFLVGDWCWEWTDSIGKNGYGKFMAADRSTVSAHRFAWAHFNKRPIPEGMHVCHSCDNRICVNPGHLWLGTGPENMKDMVQKGRSSKGDRNPNAKLTDAQAAEVYKRAINGEVMQTLADEFGVSISLVWRIKHGLRRVRADL